MSDSDSLKRSPRSFSRWWVTLLLCFAASWLTTWYNSRIEAGADVDSLPMICLQTTAPVVVDIVYRVDKEQHVGTANVLSSISGIAEYRFTNISKRSVKLSFPPERIFHFSAHSMGPTSNPPDFTLGKRVVEIAAKESVTFKSRDGFTVFNAEKSFLKGGPGFTGFVFAPPAGSETSTEYCTGTLYASYCVVRPDDKTQGEQALEVANRNLEFLKSAYQLDPPQK